VIAIPFGYRTGLEAKLKPGPFPLTGAGSRSGKLVGVGISVPVQVTGNGYAVCPLGAITIPFAPSAKYPVWLPPTAVENVGSPHPTSVIVQDCWIEPAWAAEAARIRRRPERDTSKRLLAMFRTKVSSRPPWRGDV